jgi:hypothetical protein
MGWVGKELEFHVVSWLNVCSPISRGGLGFGTCLCPIMLS